MSVTDALGQVVGFLLTITAVILLLEVLLYWPLYQFRNKLFWPVTSAIGAGIGALYAQLSDDVSLPLALFAGGLINAAIGALGAFLVRGRNRLVYLMLAPAMLAVSVIVIYPFFFELRLAFANLNLYTIGKWLEGEPLKWVGWQNFVNVFTSSPLQTASFWTLLVRTFVWTAVNVVFHVIFGLFLALLLNRQLRLKWLYRTLLIVPWAMPQVIAVLAWRGEFHPQFGVINHILQLFSLPGFNWWSDPLPVFVSCCIVNIWLGIPFMMVVFLGGLQAIPHSCFEAASLDGASEVSQFFNITLPLLKPVVVPSVTLGIIWTFNNINVIYLMTGQNGGNEYADILISALYKSAFTYSRYSFAAAFSLIIFGFLLAFTVLWMRITKGAESAAQ